MKRGFLWQLGLGASLLLASFSEAKVIVLYHTNDIHGQMGAREAFWHAENPKRLIGGFAVLANVVRREPHPHLLLDAGDIYQGTPEGGRSRGEWTLELMNAVGYDALTLGNHEFDHGEPNAWRLVRLAKFPVLGANIQRKKTGKPIGHLKPYAVLQVGGFRVGVLGLTLKTTPTATLPQNVRDLAFLDEVETAKRVMEELRPKADIVIALTHIGFSEFLTSTPTVHPGAPGARTLIAQTKLRGDLALAREVEGLTAILGGHTHTGLREPYVEPAHGTLILQNYNNLSTVGRLELDLDDRTRKVRSAKGTVVDLWVDEHGQDPEIQKKVQRYQGAVARAMDVVVGESLEELPRSDSGETRLGSWVCDVMCEKASSQVCIYNNTGIRASLPQGPVTKRHLYQLIPFDNTVVTMEMTGDQLVAVLERGIYPDGRLGIQVSGLNFTYDPDGPPSKKVVEVVVGGGRLDPKKRYAVATNSFLAAGGSGFAMFKEAQNIEDTGYLVRDLLTEKVSKAGPLKAPELGRARARK